MSYLANPQIFPQNFPPPHLDISQNDHHRIVSPDHDFSIATSDFSYYQQTNALSHALALLPTPSGDCMPSHSQPHISVESSTPSLLPPTSFGRQDSVLSASFPSGSDWRHMYQTMSGPGASTQRSRPLKRARTHQRTPSASTVASNGPASPYTANTSYPHIANTDYSPNSPAHYADSTTTFFSKNLPTPQQTPTDSTFFSSGTYMPNQAAPTPNAHLAMKTFALDQHHNFDDFPPDFITSSRQSMSSGHDSPATPQSGAGDNADARAISWPQNDYRQNPSVQLYRTESQGYQDDLYNPSTFTSTPVSATKRNPDLLSPHRNLVSERLQTANLARSASPTTSALSRERSPFRDGSPLAPAGDWKSSGQVGTVANLRQQQKEEAEQAEYAQHVPTLQREPTKTISPKDAVLDYNEPDQTPLFHDQIPTGYRQHGGASEAWQGNFVGQPSSTFGGLSAPVTSSQQMTPFRATTDEGWPEANFNYMTLPPTSQDQSQIQGTPFQTHAYAAPKMTYPEVNPEFPVSLTSMESSVSEGGPPMSSQSSFNTSSGMPRPSDTRANTGTYTCTYHGCAERFDTHVGLQRHKRDFHRSQQQRENTSTPTGTSSVSPRSTESPASSGTGMTSAAILARNSQAGPHKCTRINPSTNKPCNTIFSRPYDLTRHEDTIHNNRKQKVRCPYCREEKTFSRNDALTRHMRVVHPDVPEYGKRPRRGE